MLHPRMGPIYGRKGTEFWPKIKVGRKMMRKHHPIYWWIIVFPVKTAILSSSPYDDINNSAGESPFSTRQSTFQTILKYYVYIYICTMLVCWLCKYSVESQKLTFLGVSTAGFDHVRLKTSILGIRSMKKNMIRMGSVTVRSQLYNLPR